MAHHKREYSNGKVSAYKRRGKLVWRMTVDEYTVTDATDERGLALFEANGTRRVTRTRRVLTKQLDIPCIQYKDRNGNISYRNKAKAEAAFKEWRNSLLAKAESDYELALAKEGARKFSYASMTIPRFVSMYIAELEADGTQPSTTNGYRNATAKLCRFFEHKTIGELTSDDLTAFERHFRKEGLSDTTLGKAERILKQAVKAHKKQIGFENPFDEHLIPAPNGPDPNPLDERSLELVKADIAASRPTQFMTAVELALRTGMRQGEVCGLRWCDVSLDHGRIHICNAIGRKDGGTCYEKVPKTNKRKKGKADRFIPISAKVRRILERRFSFMVEEYKEVHIGCDDHEARDAVAKMFVVGTTDGRFQNPTVLSRTWRGYSMNLTGTKGRRPVFHDLRHSYASYAIANGIDPVTVAGILGHSDPSITMRIYADVLPKTAVAAQDKMDEIL